MFRRCGKNRLGESSTIKQKGCINIKNINHTNYVYDMIIIGGGPAGYSTALYAARAGLDTVVLESSYAGGQMALANQIDNYPGFEDGVEGSLLADKMRKHAEHFGAKSKNAKVVSVDLTANPKVIHTVTGPLFAKTAVIATGAYPRKLGIDREEELIGRGVHYCAVCDGRFYKGETVVVVGGGNTAVTDALLLSRVAKKVILVHRKDTLRATKVYRKQLMKTDNVEFRWNCTVTELLHAEKITGVRLKDINTEESVVPCDGVFVSIGRKPATEFLGGQIKLDDNGYVIAGENTKTSIPGVYAVGDVRTKLLRQVVTAVADGAVAVHAAEEYLE